MDDQTAPPRFDWDIIRIDDPDAQARGSEGWFCPRSVGVLAVAAGRTVSVVADGCRPSPGPPRLLLRLPLEAARRLHAAIGRQIAALEKVPTEEETP